MELIRDVWADNLEMEMSRIREVVEKYPYVAMDTEFPGVVARPMGQFRSVQDFQYQTVRCNVDLLKIIQLGLTFSDDKGRLPPGTCTWQFNFKFNINEDMYAQDSIDLLVRSGIDFQLHMQRGIDPNDFGELLISSGVVLLGDVKWLSFHSGYDFGYLLKVLSCKPLPATDRDFSDLCGLYFPCVYDIKYMMLSVNSSKGGLNDIADELGVSRIGPQHQAGSDSLLTSATFFRLKERFMLDESKYQGVIYGMHSGK